jgi:hypothetical protein
MKTMMKTIIPVLLVMILAGGCEDFLDQVNPNALTTASFFNSESDFEQAIAAGYSAFQINGVYGGRGWEIMNGRSDEVGATFTNAHNVFTWYLPTPGLRYPWERYCYMYKAVYRANLVLENLNTDALTDAEMTVYEAEAKFIRAWAYFILVTDWGNVPLVTETPKTVDEMINAQQSTPSQVWAQIESDLADARDGLPLEWSSDNLGRATKGAAAGMLGRAYLYQLKWSQAESELVPVTQSPYTYELMDTFEELWDENSDNCKESLLECQFGNVGGSLSWNYDRNDISETTITGKNTQPYPGCWCSMKIPPWVTAPANSPWMNDREKVYIPEEDTYPGGPYYDDYVNGVITKSDVYDPRLTSGLYFDWKIGDDYPEVYGGRFRDRLATIKDHNDPMYDDPSNKTADRALRKFLMWWLDGNDTEWNDKNWKVLRYADVLLMIAEAMNEQGNTTGAYTYVNMIRNRADLPDLSAGMTQQEMRQEIEHQRFCEFFGEGIRWYDMLRYAANSNWSYDIKAVVQSRGNDDWLHGDNFVAGKHELLPIPAMELSTNPNLQQNPGY